MWNWLTDKTSGTPRTARVSFALSGTQQKALCIAKEAIWSVCLKMPCQIFWHVCACVWLNLTVTFGLFMHIFCFLYNEIASLCMHLSDIGKRVTELISLPVYKFLMILADFLFLVNWSLTLNVSLACVSQCYSNEKRSHYIYNLSIRHEVWGLHLPVTLIQTE